MSKQKAKRAYERELRRQTVVMLPYAQKYMLLLRKTLLEGLGDVKSRKNFVDQIADWKYLQEEGEIIFKPGLMEVLTVGGTMVVERQVFKKQDFFDPITQEATAWAAGHAADLVVEINAITRGGLRQILVEWLPEVSSLSALEKLIRPLVGLTSDQVSWTTNYYNNLIDDGVAKATALKRAERKAGRYHRLRARTIARTESAASLTEGQRQGYDQIGVKKLERVEDPECCDICSEHQGQIYTIEEAKGVLPEHPNCEGTWVIAP